MTRSAQPRGASSRAIPPGGRSFERLRVVIDGAARELDRAEVEAETPRSEAPDSEASESQASESPDDAGVDEHARLMPMTSEDMLTGRTRHEVVIEGWRFEVTVESAARAALRDRARRAGPAAGQASSEAVRAPLPGRIVAVFVAPGAEVKSGARLLALEAMKMENEVRSPRAGTIASVAVAAGDRVELGDELLVIE
jgi:biotin carboxyl carrier protein